MIAARGGGRELALEYNILRRVKSDDTGSLGVAKAGRVVFFAEWDRFACVSLYLREKVMATWIVHSCRLAADVVIIEGNPRERMVSA